MVKRVPKVVARALVRCRARPGDWILVDRFKTGVIAKRAEDALRAHACETMMETGPYRREDPATLYARCEPDKSHR